MTEAKSGVRIRSASSNQATDRCRVAAGGMTNYRIDRIGTHRHAILGYLQECLTANILQTV